MAPQSPFSISTFGAIHEPPMQATLGRDRYSRAYDGVIPPVGQKRTSENTAPSARNSAAPPASCAGNSFSSLKPDSRAMSTSENNNTPDKNNKPKTKTTTNNHNKEPWL